MGNLRDKTLKIFSILTKVLHYFPEEISHFLALKGLKIAFNIGMLKYLVNDNENLTHFIKVYKVR